MRTLCLCLVEIKNAPHCEGLTKKDWKKVDELMITQKPILVKEKIMGKIKEPPNFSITVSVRGSVANNNIIMTNNIMSRRKL